MIDDKLQKIQQELEAAEKSMREARKAKAMAKWGFAFGIASIITQLVGIYLRLHGN